jgi:protein-tyrosine phosphatase
VAVQLERHLEWEGTYNVRDLGGLRTRGGARLRRGALVRSDNLARLTPAGWDALRAYGVRTIVDLRDPELETGSYLDAAEGLDVRSVSTLTFSDESFWEPFRDEPVLVRFYEAVLSTRASQLVAAVAAIARARPGGVVVHCQVGKDRTGLVIALVLSALDVPTEEIVADYTLSHARLKSLYADHAHQGELAATLAMSGISGGGVARAEAMMRVLEDLDVDRYLTGAGLAREDLAALRARLLET